MFAEPELNSVQYGFGLVTLIVCLCVCRSTGVTQPVLDYLMWHHLGSDYTERAHDLVNIYQHYFEKDVKVVRDLFGSSSSPSVQYSYM